MNNQVKRFSYKYHKFNGFNKEQDLVRLFFTYQEILLKQNILIHTIVEGEHIELNCGPTNCLNQYYYE